MLPCSGMLKPCSKSGPGSTGDGVTKSLAPCCRWQQLCIQSAARLARLENPPPLSPSVPQDQQTLPPVWQMTVPEFAQSRVEAYMLLVKGVTKGLNWWYDLVSWNLEGKKEKEKKKHIIGGLKTEGSQYKLRVIKDNIVLRSHQKLKLFSEHSCKNQQFKSNFQTKVFCFCLQCLNHLTYHVFDPSMTSLVFVFVILFSFSW